MSFQIPRPAIHLIPTDNSEHYSKRARLDHCPESDMVRVRGERIVFPELHSPYRTRSLLK